MYLTLIVAIVTSNFIFSMFKSFHTYRNINISNHHNHPSQANFVPLGPDQTLRITGQIIIFRDLVQYGTYQNNILLEIIIFRDLAQYGTYQNNIFLKIIILPGPLPIWNQSKQSFLEANGHNFLGFLPIRNLSKQQAK